MAVYPDSVRIEIYVSTWVDISSYVVNDIVGECRIRGIEPTDRVASTGSLKLTLNNTSGIFTPGIVGSLAGWKKGIPLKLTVTYGAEPVVKFYGHISDIEIDSESWGERHVEVTILDWLDYAATYPLTLNSVSYNQKINEAVTTLVSAIPIKPQKTTYSTGIDTFPTVFDTSKSNTRALSEFQKLALSEWGYIYLRRDRIYGENLVVESRHDRKSTDTATPIPISTFLSGRLKKEDGTYLLLETGDNILLDEAQVVNFDNKATEFKLSYGDNLKNYITVTSYPRRLDTSNQILYSLSSPISLAGGETKTIKVSYRDPNQLATKVSGMNMVNPVANTDYKMYQASAGTGFDLTANLTVTITFGANDALVTLQNTGSAGYVTKLNLRGIGIYTYENLELIESDSTSINSYGYSDESIDQKYQNDIYTSKGIAQVLLAQNKDPKTVLTEVTFLGNISDELIQAFFYQDLGDLIHLKKDGTAIDGYYYIQGVKFTIKQGGIINFTWLVSEARNLEASYAYWQLGISGLSELGSTTLLGY